MKILFDGWPLSREPNSPAALHLHTLLALLPPEVEPVVALPDLPPGWFEASGYLVEPASYRTSARLGCERRTLPRLARRSGSRLLHSASPSAPLLGQSISVVRPGGFDGPGVSATVGERTADEVRDSRGNTGERQPFILRLQEALAYGGLTRARAILWPDDLPKPSLPAQVIPLPPVVHPAFFVPQHASPQPDPHTPELPETYILYHGPTSQRWLLRLLEAWSWAAGPLGDYYPLLVMGLDSAASARLSRLLDQLQLSDSVLALPELLIPALVSVYQRCTALFHPAPLSPWGCPVRSALACGKPVIAFESPDVHAVVGPAAYLVPVGQARGLGAALITVVVEPEVSENLSRQAAESAAAR